MIELGRELKFVEARAVGGGLKLLGDVEREVQRDVARSLESVEVELQCRTGPRRRALLVPQVHVPKRARIPNH